MARYEPEEIPEGVILMGAIEIRYFVGDDGHPIVATSVTGPSGQDHDRPSYFEAVAMIGMAQGTLDDIYQGDTN